MVFRDSKVSTGNFKKPPMARSHSFRSLKRLFEKKQISKSIFFSRVIIDFEYASYMQRLTFKKNPVFRLMTPKIILFLIFRKSFQKFGDDVAKTFRNLAGKMD